MTDLNDTPVAVAKPLEFDPESALGFHHASTPHGHYSIMPDLRKKWDGPCRWRAPCDNDYGHDADTVAEAKAQIEAHWQNSIRSALTPDTLALIERAGKLHTALDLALARLVKFEPPDSRAISDEFVAMAAVLAGGDLATPECDAIIRAALSKEQAL